MLCPLSFGLPGATVFLCSGRLPAGHCSGGFTRHLPIFLADCSTLSTKSYFINCRRYCIISELSQFWAPIILRAIRPSGPMMYVSGYMNVSYDAAIFFDGSRKVGNVICRSRKNFSYAAASSSTLTPSTITPRPAICWCSRSSDGISSTQGAHHVAQKFSTTTRPRRSASFAGFSSSVNAKPGARLPARLGSPCL